MSENALLTNVTEVSYQKLKLLSGKTIGIRKWLMKEEKEFLFSIETQMENKELLIEECLKLSKNCCDNATLFETLSKNDLIYMLSKQRALSKGEDIEFTFKCNNTECGDFDPVAKSGRHDNESMINLKENVKTEPYDFTPIVIGDYTFHLEDIPFSKVRLMEQEFLSNPDEPELFKLNHAVMINSIEKIEIKETVHDDFTLDQLTELLDTFTHDDYTILANKIGENISTFEIDKLVTCPICNETNNIVYEEIFSLMVF